MATYRLLAAIVPLGPGELQVTVSAIPDDGGRPVVRMDTAPSLEEAEARRDYLVMSLATELRGQGHEIVSVTGDGY